MDKLYEYVKNTCVNFKLDSCCCIAPIRMGLLCVGYCNIFISLLSLVGTADDGYTPPLMAVQAFILEDDFSKPLGIVAYATEMAFNMLLLAGIYRNDIVLLRVYMYFVCASIISSVLVYSIVFIRISALTKTLIILILVFQFYLIILVRSLIVEIKETRALAKNGHVTLYSVVQMPDELPTKVDEVVQLPDELPTKADEQPTAEITVDPQTTKEHQRDDEIVKQKKDEPSSELETVAEHPKEK